MTSFFMGRVGCAGASAFGFGVCEGTGKVDGAAFNGAATTAVATEGCGTAGVAAVAATADLATGGDEGALALAGAPEDVALVLPNPINRRASCLAPVDEGAAESLLLLGSFLVVETGFVSLELFALPLSAAKPSPMGLRGLLLEAEGLSVLVPADEAAVGVTTCLGGGVAIMGVTPTVLLAVAADDTAAAGLLVIGLTGIGGGGILTVAGIGTVTRGVGDTVGCAELLVSFTANWLVPALVLLSEMVALRTSLAVSGDVRGVVHSCIFPSILLATFSTCCWNFCTVVMLIAAAVVVLLVLLSIGGDGFVLSTLMVLVALLEVVALGVAISSSARTGRVKT
jgi:hypothetical protein